MKKSLLLAVILLVVAGDAGAIPNPAAVYCSERGYKYENGVCIFPDGSECDAWQFYCNCEPNGIGCWPGDFNCPWPCEELPCREAGEFVSISKCCQGLSEIPRIEAYDHECNLVGWLGWVYICSDCGNGICESWENKCNCPEDCNRVVVAVMVDIKPQSCPNPLNVKSKGVLPAAVLGSEEFDVNTIELASIRLAGVAPVSSSFEDVAAPVPDGNDCQCTTEGPDGYLDLTLKFKTQQIVEAIGEVDTGDKLTLELTGMLFDGRPIKGADCILVRGKHKPSNKAGFTKDGAVDAADFAILAQNWLQSSVAEN